MKIFSFEDVIINQSMNDFINDLDIDFYSELNGQFDICSDSTSDYN